MNNIHTTALCFLLLMAGGCGTIGGMEQRGKVYDQTLYPATLTDSGMFCMSISGESILHSGDCNNAGIVSQTMGYTIIPLCFLIDMPISLVTDTLCLPYDIYRVSTDVKPLVLAVQEDSLSEVKELIRDGANVNQEYEFDTPLIIACRGNSENNYQGNMEMVELLIDNGADVNQPGPGKVTPLMLTKNIAIAELLISKGADVNAQTSKGTTALMNSLGLCSQSTTKALQMMRLLIDHGADVNAIDGVEHESILDMALANYPQSIASFLRNHGAKTANEPRRR